MLSESYLHNVTDEAQTRLSGLACKVYG